MPALAPRLVLPAHEAIVERPSKRIAEILEHHRHRLAAEAVGLDVADVLEAHEGGHALSVRFGKGRKSRVVPVRDDVAHLLRVYLAGTGRTLSAEGPLFRAFDDLHLDAELRDIETEILQAF